MVGLSALNDESLVPATVVAALGLSEESHRSPLSVLTDYLREKQLLLLLDNCEHLIDACAQLADHLLDQCPGLKILATSREPLGTEGEEVVHVPSLKVPSKESDKLHELEQVESVRLFSPSQIGLP
jgi:non-specific serine/threonine protein kinase